MNKQELIAAVAEDTGMSKVAAERAVNSVLKQSLHNLVLVTLLLFSVLVLLVPAIAKHAKV